MYIGKIQLRRYLLVVHDRRVHILNTRLLTVFTILARRDRVTLQIHGFKFDYYRYKVLFRLRL